MREYALILISTVFVNNFVLVKFLGLCPFMGVSRKYGASFGMGLATTLVLMVTSALTYLTETYILAPLEITYLRTIAYIFVIALVVQTLEIRTLRGPGHLPPAHHHELHRAGAYAPQYVSAAQLRRERHLRARRRARLHSRHPHVLGDAREA